VSATGDTIAAIQAFIQQLQQAATAAKAAISQAEQGRAKATGVGDARSITTFTQVHQLLSEAHRSVGATIGQAERAMTWTKAMQDGGGP